MSRTKKSRRLKNRLNVKTGSKKDFLDKDQLGKIPSKNKLAKHKKRQKSAYEKALEEQKKNTQPTNEEQVKEAKKPVSVDVKAEKKPKPSEQQAVKPKEEEKKEQDFNSLSGDDLLDMFNGD